MRDKMLGIALLGAVTLSAQTPRAPSAVGSLTNGHYHHNRTGIEFSVTPEWSLLGEGPSSGRGESVGFRDSTTDATLYAWMVRRSDETQWLDSKSDMDTYQHLIGVKIEQRHVANLNDYWIRSDRVEHPTIGGRMALKAVGEYTIVRSGPGDTAAKSERLSECLTWIHSDSVRVLFSSTVRSADLASYQPRFDQVVATAVLP